MKKLIKVNPIFPLSLELEYETGEIRIFNIEKYCKSEFFQELKDWNYFNQVQIKNHTVTWPNEQDIAPETVYLNSVPLTEIVNSLKKSQELCE